MSRDPKPPRVVAELGRPETPEETAARKAKDSRNHRTRQTALNLVLSLGATLVIVLVLVLLVPRSDESLVPDVDFHSAAVEAQNVRDETVLDPTLPKGWTSNSAELSQREDPKVSDWYIGLITPDDEYIGIRQGFDANPTWQARQLKETLADRTVEISGITWTVYDNRDRSSDDVGNVEYALATEAGDSTILIFGTAGDDDFRTVAKAVADQVKANLNPESKGTQ